MSSFEFVIPLQKDELLEPHAGKYHVEDIVQTRLLISKLQDAARAYNADGVEYILDHFDTYFSILIHGNKLEWPTINKGYEHVIRVVKNLCNHYEDFFQNKEIASEDREKNLNLLKMIMYLYIQFIKLKDSKQTADNSTKLTLGKKNKKSAEDEACNWTESDKQAALVTLHAVLQHPLSRLWDPPLAEDNFVSMVAEPCYKAMEEQIIKNKACREVIFQVIGLLIKKYNHGTACIIKLVQVLQMVEHAVSPICAGVVQLSKEFGLASFAPQIVREIAEALASTDEDAGGVGAEQGAAKNCGAFLLELTKELPKEMTGAINTLQSYLESDDSYILRISILGMMCEAVCAELQGEGLSEAQKSQRDDFLDCLYEHMHDMSAYVRHKVVQYWSRMQRENCIPVNRQRAVLERGVGRLRDKAALVRKAAIHLLKVFLECNPFSAQLKLDILEEQLATEMKMLEELQSKLKTDTDPELVQQWNQIEKDVIATIKEKLNNPTQDEPDLSQASLVNLYDSIRKHIKSEEYSKAYIIVKNIERQYPQAKLLRCSMDKSDQIKYFTVLLKNVFVTVDKSSSDEDDENELAHCKRIEEKENIVAFLQESVNFCHIVADAMPIINSLLMSKQAGDVSEAIEFFTAAYHFHLDCAKEGIGNMLLLVWSQDQDKREAVERAYRSMYLEGSGGGAAGGEHARAYGAARRLAALCARLDRGAALALDHLVSKWVQRGDVTPPLIQVLWEMFLKKIDGTTDIESYASLTLLVMIAKAKPSVAVANLEVIQTHGLTADYKTRNLSSQLLLALANKEQRYPLEHEIFKSLYKSLIEAYLNMNKFTSFAANSIDLVYAVCDTPDVFCAKLLAEMYEGLEAKKQVENDDNAKYPTELLLRFIFVIGHIAMQQLIYLDISVYNELRRRNQVREQRKQEEKRKKKMGAAATPARHGRVAALMNLSTASASSRARLQSLSGTPTVNTTMTEEEGGVEGAVADDADAAYVRGVCERDVVGAGSALARYVPLARWALAAPAAPPRLQAAAAIAYTRCMLVSSAVCDEGLQLIVTALKKSKNVALRTNLTIAFADLTLRFPNLTEPWTPHIYHVLKDGERTVRECAVKVVSFLVLHEMVRVRGHVADMALCCADADARVATMTRNFFRQLARKGNALYNVMPDVISRLGDPELDVPEHDYRDIMKFITSLIQKDRQMEALVEKLCQRFTLANTERQWRDLAYCLSLFNYNERSLRKLIDNIDTFKDKLHAPGVMDCFNTLINNTSKLARNDIKNVVTELGEKLEECFAVRDAVDGEPREASRNSAVVEARGVRASVRGPKGTPRRVRTPRRRSSGADENEPPNSTEIPQSCRKSSRQQMTRAKKNTYSFESDSDEEVQAKEDDVFKKPTTARKLRSRK